MPYYGTGDYALGGGLDSGLGYVGRVADGNATVTSGLYVFNGMQIGENLGGVGPVTGTLRLTNASTNVSVEDNSTPGFDGGVIVGRGNFAPAIGTLEILNGAQLSSNNSAYLDSYSGYVVGGYNNINIGVGVPFSGTGTVIVDGAGSRVIAAGGAPRITVGSFEGIGTLDVSDGGYVGTLSLKNRQRQQWRRPN